MKTTAAHHTRRVSFLVVTSLLFIGCAPALEGALSTDLQRETRRRRAGARGVGPGVGPSPGDGKDQGAHRPSLKKKRFTETSKLRHYQLVAALHNDALRAAFYRWRAAVKQIRLARSLPEPRISYTYYIQNVETRVGPQRHRLALSQQLPSWTDLKYGSKAAAHAARAAQRRYEAEKLALFSKVAKAYAQRHHLGRLISIHGGHLQLMKTMGGFVKTLYTVGKASHADTAKIQLEIARLEDRITSLKERLPASAAQLNALLGRRTDAPLPVPRDLPKRRPKLHLAQLKRSLRSRNPILREARSQQRRYRSLEKKARFSPVPKIKLKFGFIETGPAKMPNVADSGKDALTATIAFQIPILFGKYSAQREAASARASAARQTVQHRAKKLSAKLVQAYYTYRAAVRREKLLTRGLIPKAKETLTITQRALAHGEARFIDLLDAQKTLLRMEESLARVQRHVLVSLAAVAQLSGTTALGQDSPRQEKKETP